MTLLAAICICAATWRKRTIGTRWETCATVGIALVAAGEMLANSDALAAGLAAAFGVSWLDDFAGNLCYLASAIAFLCHFLGRLTAEDQMQREMITAWAQGPLTLVVAIMFACLMQAQDCCAGRTLLTHSAGDFDWLDAYGTTWYLGMAYLTTIGMRLLRILHRERRTLSVDMYLTSAGVSLAAYALRISSFVADSNTLDSIATVLSATSIMLGCAAASWSWYGQMRPYRALLRGTRTGPCIGLCALKRRAQRLLDAAAGDWQTEPHGPPL